MIVVIPSSRQIDLSYLSPLIDSGARFIIVDDTEGTIQLRHPQFTVVNWADRRKILGPLDAAIPRRNGASRDLGFLLAWRESDDDEIIVALDDDCLVEDSSFAQDVQKVFDDGVSYVACGSGDFLNILDLYSDVDSERVFPRGFPYSKREAYDSWEFRRQPPRQVVFNLGLWSGILDVNAIDRLSLPSWEVDDSHLTVPNVVIPPGVLGCLCSMNMHFRRAAIPAVYQLPMHVEVMPNGVIDRYGDIWGGFVLQTLAALRGDSVSLGGPTIRHLKQGDFQRNIWQEHLGHLVNDEFIEVIRHSGEQIQPAGYFTMMCHMSELIAEQTERRSPILRAYFRHLAVALSAWVQALS